MVVQYTAMQHNLDDVLVGCDLVGSVVFTLHSGPEVVAEQWGG